MSVPNPNLNNVEEVLDLIDMVGEGIPVHMLEDFMKTERLTQTEITALGIAYRTFMRRKKQERLKSDESDKVIRLFRMIQFANTVFGDRDKAHTWLRRPNKALKNKVPLALLKTEPGARLVETMLGRIEQGIYS